MLIVIPNGWLAGWLSGILPYNQYANMPICQRPPPTPEMAASLPKNTKSLIIENNNK